MVYFIYLFQNKITLSGRFNSYMKIHGLSFKFRDPTCVSQHKETFCLLLNTGQSVHSLQKANGQENTHLNNILYVYWHNTKRFMLQTLLLCLKLTRNVWLSKVCCAGLPLDFWGDFFNWHVLACALLRFVHSWYVCTPLYYTGTCSGWWWMLIRRPA